MAHELQTMAYINAEPWHDLGNKLTPNQPIERWQREAGMEWQIREAPVLFNANQDEGSILNLRSNAVNSKTLLKAC